MLIQVSAKVLDLEGDDNVIEVELLEDQDLRQLERSQSPEQCRCPASSKTNQTTMAMRAVARGSLLFRRAVARGAAPELESRQRFADERINLQTNYWQDQPT